MVRGERAAQSRDLRLINEKRRPVAGRPGKHIDLVERYCKEQGLWRDKSSEPEFSEILELDLGTVTPSLAGPKRPQDRVELPNVHKSFGAAFKDALVTKTAVDDEDRKSVV